MFLLMMVVFLNLGPEVRVSINRGAPGASERSSGDCRVAELLRRGPQPPPYLDLLATGTKLMRWEILNFPW